MILTSVTSGLRNVRLYPELEGRRVLITGMTATQGLDVARGFAESGCRLVVQIEAEPDACAESAALLEVLSHTAAELRATQEALNTDAAVVRFAQGAAQAYGGLDVVVNLIPLKPGAIDADTSVDDIEAMVSDALRTACLVTKVAANRMSLTWTDGLILNVALAQSPRTRSQAAVLDIVRAALSAMTRVEAVKWAGNGLRINAIGPAAYDPSSAAACDFALSNEPDIAALALHLASERGKSLSGLVFDAEGVAARRC